MGDELRDFVKKEFLKRKISHRAFADKVGVSHAFISSVLKGTRPVTWDFCDAVSRGLNEPILKILVMGGLIDELPDEVWEDEELKEVLLKYRSLPVKGKEEFKEFLDWMIAKYKS